MQRYRDGNKLTVLYGVLTALAALAILVMSSMPAVFLMPSIPDLTLKPSMSALPLKSGMPSLSSKPGIIVLSMKPGRLALSTKTVMPVNSGFILHLFAYGILCVLLCLYLHSAGKTCTPALYAALLTSLFGVLVECLQFGVPYRSFELRDILVNSCAAAIVIIPCHLILRYIPQYKNLPNR